MGGKAFKIVLSAAAVIVGLSLATPGAQAQIPLAVAAASGYLEQQSGGVI